VGEQALPHLRLHELADSAVVIARKAKRQRKGLGGANHYAEKLAHLRAEAAVALRNLAGGGGDIAPLTTLVDACFLPSTVAKERLAAARELAFELRTSWSAPAAAPTPGEEDAIFPLEMLGKRKYLVSIGRQANGCFVKEWFDACGVMMRRLLEVAILEAFEHRGLEAKIKNDRGEYFQLTELAKAALDERWPLSRKTKPVLLDLVGAGHRPAHGKLLTYKKYIEEVRQGYRDAVEDFLRLADLL
jgi:hypothetical protein